MASNVSEKKGKQEIKVTFDFINHDDPDSSNHNEIHYVDSPAVIALIEAGAILPGFIMMCERLNQMAEAKAVAGGGPDIAAFLASLSK